MHSKTGIEVQAFLKLAVPLASAQLAQAAVGFVDTIMMGRLGTEILAAGGLASAAFQFLLNIASGFVMAVSPFVAEAYGAGRYKQIEQLARQGLWLSLFLSLPIMATIYRLGFVLEGLGQSASIVELAVPYFHLIAWGIFPALGFAMLRGYVSALAQAHIVTVIVAIGTLFNIVGNYALGFGQFGFPRLGLAGLGLASGLSYWLMFLIFLAYIFQDSQLKRYRFLQDLYRLKPKILMRLIATGTAIATTVVLEYGLFTIVTFLMGLLGTAVLAAHQAVYQTMYLLFTVPMGMSFAATVRVGQAFGQQDHSRIRRAGYVGIVLVTGFMVLTAIALVIYRRQVIGIYLDVHNPANAQIIAMAMPMLLISALAQILDGIQRVALGALYGLQDTRLPVLLSGVAFWGIGLTSGWLLGFLWELDGVGLLIGQSTGVAVAGLLFVWRFHRLTAPKHYFSRR
ncbi:MATE family efflux transporter [Romeria aff. gracilis LEGE 07310]|uniref:Probable multidrug resistance protein NorM n=1 Tax=Vasconcelosia minhoensis LEGE 07310 TaxID=915328 RepID=A0A8J7A7F9_9CYAN|nr:MATE family efflux transporter [Romeria gracilis]MBE9078302.1 MATE family efflux transporter [Romeria aff. gracilis LEGE 07310]